MEMEHKTNCFKGMEIKWILNTFLLHWVFVFDVALYIFTLVSETD